MTHLEPDPTREPDWNDLRVPMSALATVTGAGLKAPDYVQLSNNGAGSTGIYNAAYSPTQEQELFFTAQMPHSWQEETDVHPHIHWSPSDTANTGTVVWGLEYTWVNVNGLIGNTTIILAYGVVDGLGRRNELTEFGIINGSGMMISSQFGGRIFRDATNPLDTYPDSAFLLEVDFHYKQNSLGSGMEYSK